MTSTFKFVWVFAVGLFVGGAGGCACGALFANRGPSYELSDDVVLRHGAGTNQASGVLHAGQRFDVTMRKGDVNYLRVYVISYDRDLAGHTRDAHTGLKTNDAPWDLWAKWNAEQPKR